MLRCAAAAAGIMLATVALEELLRFIGVRDVELALLFMLSTFLIAFLTPSYAINISAAVFNTFLYDFLVTPPRLGFSFTIGLPITLLFMLTVSIVTSATTTKLKDQMAKAVQQERRTELMLEINQKMSVAESVHDIVGIAADHLARYSLAGVFYIGDPLAGEYALFPPGGAERAAPAAAANEDAHRFFEDPALCKSHNAGQSGRLYIPVTASGAPLGIILLQNAAALDKDQAAFAHLLAGQTGLAMELRRVAQERTQSRLAAEKEKTHSNLLRAISHDLRTPLTVIHSASSILLEKTGDPLADNIRTDSEWLIHMVENLLAVTRISDGGHRIAKKTEMAEEVMAKSTAIVRKRYPGCHILASAPEELLIVPMDAMLLSQVFINLLENAVKYSPRESPVCFDVCRTGGMACFTVGDSGGGLPEELLNNLFGQHAPADNRAVDSASGTGLGLSICKTIVEAHGGVIFGQNKEEGGALFTVLLPVDA